MDKDIKKTLEIIKKCKQSQSYENLLKKEDTELYNKIVEETLWLDKYNLNFTTKLWYFVHDLKQLDKCYICGSDITTDKGFTYYKKTGKLDDIGITKCRECHNKYGYKQSNKAKAERFARLEKDSYKKERILATYDIFYNDEKINLWASEFFQKYNRKPTKDDFTEFFGRKFFRRDSNRNLNTSLFDLWDSYLELRCVDYIKELGFTEKYVLEACTDPIDFIRNKMFKDESGKSFQIDVYFPFLKIGFEINDFMTHSKDSDTEIYNKVDRGFKHGPTYHNNKKKQSKNLGIKLYYIWEDEIRHSEEYKGIIKETLCI